MKVRKAIIPAAGLGTRVLPASKAVPKEMLNIVDKPAIQYIVEEAAAAGIEDILIITNRGKGVIEDHFDHSYELEDKLKDNPSKKDLYEDVLASEECVTLKDLAVNGSILMEEGFPKGKQMGEILKALLEEVLEDPEKNQKDILLRIAKERFPQEGR